MTISFYKYGAIGETCWTGFSKKIYPQTWFNSIKIQGSFDMTFHLSAKNCSLPTLHSVDINLLLTKTRFDENWCRKCEDPPANFRPDGLYPRWDCRCSTRWRFSASSSSASFTTRGRKDFPNDSNSSSLKFGLSSNISMKLGSVNCMTLRHHWWVAWFWEIQKFNLDVSQTNYFVTLLFFCLFANWLERSSLHIISVKRRICVI